LEVYWPLGIILGWTLSFLQQIWTRKQNRKDEEWKQTQLRINTFLEKRLRTYSEGLEFVYDVEQYQRNARGLESVQKRWSKWHPSNCLYLPPSVRDALHGAMNFTTAIIVDLGNQDNDRETWQTFKGKLQEAKTQLMNLSDVGWLPKDLE